MLQNYTNTLKITSFHGSEKRCDLKPIPFYSAWPKTLFYQEKHLKPLKNSHISRIFDNMAVAKLYEHLRDDVSKARTFWGCRGTRRTDDGI